MTLPITSGVTAPLYSGPTTLTTGTTVWASGTVEFQQIVVTNTTAGVLTFTVSETTTTNYLFYQQRVEPGETYIREFVYMHMVGVKIKASADGLVAWGQWN